jgi:hypothetical protein
VGSNAQKKKAEKDKLFHVEVGNYFDKNEEWNESINFSLIKLRFWGHIA